VGNARGEKGHAEWREWLIQIFEIWIRYSEDEGRCVLLPGHLLCHIEVREGDGSGTCDGVVRGIKVPIGAHKVHKFLKRN
jgi:hypothetical protein